MNPTLNTSWLSFADIVRDLGFTTYTADYHRRLQEALDLHGLSIPTPYAITADSVMTAVDTVDPQGNLLSFQYRLIPSRMDCYIQINEDGRHLLVETHYG